MHACLFFDTATLPLSYILVQALLLLNLSARRASCATQKLRVFLKYSLLTAPAKYEATDCSRTCASNHLCRCWRSSDCTHISPLNCNLKLTVCILDPERARSTAVQWHVQQKRMGRRRRPFHPHNLHQDRP